MVNLIHRAEVLTVHRLGPGMVRIVLGGEGLADFTSTGVGDEYLRLWLPHEGEREPVLPRPAGRDSWQFDDGVKPSPLRTYTVRAWNPETRELAIDMVVHARGLAADWARHAAPGDIVGVNTPRGMYDAPRRLDWLLMVTDAAGLPAAARILESTPPGVRTRVVLEVPGPAYEQPLDTPPDAEVHWTHGGNGLGPSRIEEVVRAADRPAGSGYIWVAGETRATRGVRRYLRHELGLPPSAYKVVGYWTDGAEEWNARYEALPSEVLSRIEALWDDPARHEEEIEDEYEAVLERYNL